MPPMTVWTLLLCAAAQASPPASVPVSTAAAPGVPAPAAALLRMRPPSAGRLSDWGVDLASPEAARLRLDSAFDGSPRPETDPRAWPGVGTSLELQNGQIRRFAWTYAPQDFTLEAGHLAVVPRNGLIAPSGYVAAVKGFSHEGVLDANLKVQAGVADLQARLFTDDNPALDAKVQSSLQAAQQLAGMHGYVDPSVFAAIQNDTQVDTSFQSQHVFIGSALAQAGKAFHLDGPFDFGLVAGGVGRLVSTFPSGAIDQTAALRLRAPQGVSGAFFMGVTEALGLFGPTFWQDSFQNEKVAANVHIDVAPHVGAEVWGPVPGLPRSTFDLGVEERFGPLTETTAVRAATEHDLGRAGALSLAGRYDREKGDAIEYSRQRGSAELGYRPNPDLELYGGYAVEKMAYGDVSLSNQVVQLGVRGRDSRSSPAVDVSIEQIFGGGDDLVVPASDVQGILDQIQGLASFLDDVQAAYKSGMSGGSPPPPSLQASYNALDPALRAQVASAAGSSGGASNGTGSSDLTLGQIVSLAATLVDSDVYERIVVLYLRHKLLTLMATKKVPIFGEHVLLTPPLVLALANAYSVGVSPVPPITEKDAQSGLTGFVFGQLKSQLGSSLIGKCTDSKTPQDFTDCLLDNLPPDQAAQLKAKYGAQVGQVLGSTLQWGAELVRREVNTEILQIIMAAEALNAATVDKGVKVSELDQRWLVDSFRRMDARKKGRLSKALRIAHGDVEGELKEQEKVLRLKLAAYGRQRLEEAKADVEVSYADWAPLLANYGDDGLFGLIQGARRRLGPSTRLKLEFNPIAELGTSVEERPGLAVLRLPPVGPGARPDFILSSALDALEPEGASK